MSRTTLLLCRAIVVEFAVIIISFSLFGMLYYGKEGFLTGISLFFPIIIGALPSLLTALFIGNHIKPNPQQLFENIFLGVILMFLFFLIAVITTAVVLYFIMEGRWIHSQILSEILTLSFYGGGIQTLGVGIWLGGKFCLIKQSSKK